MASSEEHAATQSAHTRDTPGHYPSDSDESHQRGVASDPRSLSQAVKLRRAEYTRQRSIRIKIGTWNVAAIAGTEKDVGEWFVHGKGVCERLSTVKARKGREEQELHGHERSQSQDSHHSDGSDDKSDSPVRPEDVGIYALGLQEIVDVSSPSEALRPFVDPGPSTRWKEAMKKALPQGYELVAEQQLVGLLILIYASPAVAGSISSVSSTSVGTGLMGYMGNKGAVATRIVLGETARLVFVNCHLAAGSDKASLERRNWDASQIVARARFAPLDPEDDISGEPSDSIGKEDFAFWFGDLNYRLDDIPGDDVRRLLSLHTQNTYDATHESQRKTVGDSDTDTESQSLHVVGEDDDSSAGSSHITVDSVPVALVDKDIESSSDPENLRMTLSSLLPHDQLIAQQKKEKAFHEGWREGEINFLPTYKYDVGSVAMFDSSEKQRGPSWCDRILYRTWHDKRSYERRVQDAKDAKKKDEEMKARGLDKAVEDDNVLFEYDPDVDGTNEFEEYDETEDAAGDPAPSESRVAYDDPVRLDHYLSHQGILCSDHKPLDALFTLTYNSVIPDLKAKVHQEVARELDKAENEARPSLTVVVDHHAELQGGVGEGAGMKDPNAVNFGDVPYDVHITRSLTVANTSSVPATFTFAERAGGSKDTTGIAPHWLEINVHWPPHEKKHESKKHPSQDEYTLSPGDTANIDLVAIVKEISQVRLLNSGHHKLEDVLVLRVTSGRDHFIPVNGRWLPTCFGRSLEELVYMPEGGARSLLNTPPDQKSGMKARLSAPRELFRLTEAISDLAVRAVAEWSMMKGEGDSPPPWTFEPHGTTWPFGPEAWTMRDEAQRAPFLAAIREALDTNGSLNDVFPPEILSLHRLELLSETLVAFIRSLDGRIITKDIFTDMSQRMLSRERAQLPPQSTEEAQAWVLEGLSSSPAHSVSFTFITFMLLRIANEIAPVSALPARPPPAATKSPMTSVTEEDPGFAADLPSAAVPPLTSPTTAASFMSATSLRQRARTLTTSTSSEDHGSTALQRRQVVEKAFASLFADIIIAPEVEVPHKDKERRAWEERRRNIIEPFLKTVGVDDYGPSGGAT
ncbi:conserved hypothetical protein [Paecilomyces variotii No. 5]|uniref:Inositol polyphosphate-related phosphatase domain-containing protein n=1 Tax=Byssochlamys spectabilis (strain No. 5 / NBRC 109023) TaxID=1356009 RepID=V5I310_BYSSN|nr:conserved hypothetical protein [Paecilomyces variotii No. 5]